MRDKFFDTWEKRNQESDIDKREELEEEMADLLRQYVWENYADLEEDEEQIAVLKRDFESDLPHRVLADAINVEVDMCRRFRYMDGRGVFDTQERERKSIPPSIRDKVLERDDHQCVKCGTDEELTLHHIIPRSQGGMDAMSNYAMVCDDCHIQAHAGNFGSKRMAYEDIDDFWDEFCQE